MTSSLLTLVYLRLSLNLEFEMRYTALKKHLHNLHPKLCSSTNKLHPKNTVLDVSEMKLRLPSYTVKSQKLTDSTPQAALCCPRPVSPLQLLPGPGFLLYELFLDETSITADRLR